MNEPILMNPEPAGREPQVVLIVEDEPAIASLEKNILQRAGYTVELCQQGEAALTRMRNGGLSITLLDYQLPDMNGAEVIRRMGDELARLPVVVITGHGDEQLAVELLKQGIADYLVKGTPNFVHILTATVKSSIERFQLANEKRLLESRLCESELTFRNTFNAIPDPAYVWLRRADAGIELAQVNVAGDQLSSPRFPALVGVAVETFFGAEAAICERIKSALVSGEPVREERFGSIFTGEPRWFSLDYVKFKEDGVLLIARDITLRKQAEEALKQSREILERRVAERTAELSTANQQLQLEVVERKRAQEILTRHLDLDGAIAAMASRLVASENLESDIKAGVELIARAGQAGRAYVYLMNADGKSADLIYERCEGGMGATPLPRQATFSAGAADEWWMGKLRRGEAVYLPDRQGAPSAFLSDETGTLPTAQAQAVIILPFIVGGRVSGILGFEDTGAANRWNADDVLIVKTAAEIIGYALEARAARRSLEESEEKYRNLVERATDGIAIIQDECVIFANERMAAITGYTTAELLHKPVEELLHPDQRDRVMDIYRRRLAGEKVPEVYEGALLHKNGARIDVEFNAGFINYLGQVADLVLVRDITERLRLETQLRHAQKLESIGTLAAGIAHEINTPTQFVGDNLEFLTGSFGDLMTLVEKQGGLVAEVARGGDAEAALLSYEKAVQAADWEYLSQEVPKALAQSQDGVKRVAEIVRAMKAFAHPGPEVKTPVDINAAIKNTILVARNEWKYVADLETELDPRLPLVTCLPGDFNQVILNIIVNAAHSIGDVVGDGSRGKGKIGIATRQDAEWAEIRISDSGTGIPAAVKGRIFDPFFTTKEVGRGTGQGLAIAHTVIVEKHRGTIGFETEEGKGTTFIIRLPIETPQ